ncbi:hypothetical protein ACFLVR_03990 [Chloroflexota bacterium]
MTDIRKKVKRNTLGYRSDRVNHREHDYINRLYAQHKTPKQISETTGRSLQTIRSHIDIERPVKSHLSPQQLHDIRRLADALHQHLHVPRPDTKMPIDDLYVYEYKFEETEKGNTNVRTWEITALAPWWKRSEKAGTSIYFGYDQRALLKHFLELPQCDKLKALLALWERKTDIYLQLQLSNTKYQQLQTAYQEAKEAEDILRAELSDVVESLRWQ